MTIRSNGMKVRNRNGFLVKVFCIVFFCSLIIYALHFYRKVYDFSSKRVPVLNPLSEMSQSAGMENSGIFGNVVGDSVNSNPQSQSQIMGLPVVPLEHKIVHLDLKGMPFVIEAYKNFFPLLKSAGATGVLIEYEDMFPFDGPLRPIANKKAYSASEIKMILELAQTSGLEVIPLIQTFGHLEFVLKLEEFASLREVYKAPQVICPTNNQSLELVKGMIDQVMKLHPDVKYLHIGSDEVYYIGMCPLCQDRMNKEQSVQADLFLQHVKFVASYVKEKYRVQPMMWDDEFRNLDDRLIRRYGIDGDLVEIVVWNYHPDVVSRLPSSMWAKYGKIFESAWAGTAFKGANKPNSIVVNETLYLTNHYSWMNVMADNQERIKFKGVILTGWQRYDHFSVLCEIMPSAMPSLVSCLTYLSLTGQQPTMDRIFSLASTFLECESNRLFCRFPGSDIYNDAISLATIENGLKRIKEEHIFLGWTQDVNFEFSFSNPAHAESILQQVVKLRLDLQRLQTSLTPSLESMFPAWSVYEWMLTHFHPLLNEVSSLEEKLHKLTKLTVFPARPLAYPPKPNEQSDH